jgi:hypothetical protein
MSDGGLTAEQERALAAALDAIVPRSPDGRMPGAGEIGLAAQIGNAAPGVRNVVVAALAALDALAARRGHAGFAAVPADGRADVVAELAAAHGALFGGLVFQAYAAYYQQPRVIETLGLEARAPYPKGYEVAPLDPALVEPVRRMGKRYRDG